MNITVSMDADVSCPADVLATGTLRLGNHQPNNLYIVSVSGVEYFIGALFRASYGPPLIDRLNRDDA